MSKWRELRVLVLGRTYPAYSKKYDELACTGGILEDSFELVRFPIPYRYLEKGEQYKAFQWIRAKFKMHSSDPRPESLQILQESIEVMERVPPSRPEERISILEKSPNLVRSVKDLKKKQKETGLSLGILKPKEIVRCRLVRSSEKERREWIERERAVLSRPPLFGNEPMPIDFPETKFRVQWKCDDPECECPHEMSLRQWGLHELNRNYRGRSNREEKVLEAMYLVAAGTTSCS